MKVYSYGEDGLVSRPSLLNALNLPEKPHLVVCLAGGGGKTSVMYGLADELAASGKRVIVTTTTHIFYPTDRCVVETDQAEIVGNWIAENKKTAGPGKLHGDSAEAVCENSGREAGWNDGRVIVVGQTPAAKQSGEVRKMTGLPLNEIGKLSRYADVLLIEADGAKRLPIKVPREGEPVIPPETDVVIGCAGLDCIGLTMEETCFRTELAEKLLGYSGNHRMTASDVARILTDENGTKKSVGALPYRIVLNKADNQERRQKAVAVIEEIERLGGAEAFCCTVTCFLSVK